MGILFTAIFATLQACDSIFFFCLHMLSQLICCHYFAVESPHHYLYPKLVMWWAQTARKRKRLSHKTPIRKPVKTLQSRRGEHVHGSLSHHPAGRSCPKSCFCWPYSQKEHMDFSVRETIKFYYIRRLGMFGFLPQMITLCSISPHTLPSSVLLPFALLSLCFVLSE